MSDNYNTDRVQEFNDEKHANTSEDLHLISVNPDNCLCSRDRMMSMFKHLDLKPDQKYRKSSGHPNVNDIDFVYAIFSDMGITHSLVRLVNMGTGYYEYSRIFINECPICGKKI